MNANTQSSASLMLVEPRWLPRGGKMATHRGFARAIVVALLGALLSLPALPAPARAVDNGQFVRGGFHYPAGNSWTSANQRYQLVMQRGDGNLVVYDRFNGQVVPVWASNTNCADPVNSFLTMLNNGSVEVRCGNVPRWSSNFNFVGGGGSFMKIQNDGKLVVYRGTPEAAGAAFSWNCRWDRNARPNVGFCRA